MDKLYDIRELPQKQKRYKPILGHLWICNVKVALILWIKHLINKLFTNIYLKFWKIYTQHLFHELISPFYLMLIFHLQCCGVPVDKDVGYPSSSLTTSRNQVHHHPGLSVSKEKDGGCGRVQHEYSWTRGHAGVSEGRGSRPQSDWRESFVSYRSTLVIFICFLVWLSEAACFSIKYTLKFVGTVETERERGGEECRCIFMIFILCPIHPRHCLILLSDMH